MCICNPNSCQDIEVYYLLKNCLHVSDVIKTHTQPSRGKYHSFLERDSWLILSLKFHINEITQNIHVCVSVLLKSMFFRFYIYIK